MRTSKAARTPMSKAERMLWIKRSANSVAVVAYLGVASVGTAFGSAALFQLFHKHIPTDLSLTTTRDDWRATATNLPERKKLYLAIGIPAGALFFFLPMFLASLGPKRRELHGSARFAKRIEIQQAGLYGDRGIILGKYEDKFLLLGGQQSVLLSAPTRSGKGVSAAIPNLLSWPDSVCVLDIKGENFERTAGFRAKYAQKVYAWAPFAEDSCTHRYNPLSYIRAGTRHVVGDILSIAQIIYPTSVRGSGTESFFNDQARNLFLGLALYLVETPELPRTIGELLRQSSGKGKPPKTYLQDLIKAREDIKQQLSNECVDALMRFLATSDNTLSSIQATLNAPLTAFVDPLVDAATSADDFSLLDLRRQRMSVYVIVPPNRLADAAVLLNLFYSQLLNLNTKELPSQDKTLKYQCLLVNDEFVAMGRVAIFAKALGYLSGYNLRLLTIVQAQSQLDSAYGDKDSRSMVTNHAVQLLFAPREQRDANEYSEMLGTFTEKSDSKGKSRNFGARGGSSHSTNTSDQRRALLMPQEFKELGTEKEVILVENVKPILADKIRYYSDPMFMSRVLTPPELPEVDVKGHGARIDQRIRQARDDEEFTVDQIAAVFSKLPTLFEDSAQEDIDRFVSEFFVELAMEEPASESDSRESEMGKEITL
ncbi:MAG: type IV secretory system conjugative DNA transfer family protein [Pseudomonadota bacterium]|nr:type IV secretory system conjugative DNA transfer family protein [Pseudomonadota bacterium]